MTPEEMVARAEQTNARRDQNDRANGFGAPSDGPTELALETCILAVWCGMKMQDWDTVAEGLAMLGDVSEFRPWRVTR